MEFLSRWFSILSVLYFVYFCNCSTRTYRTINWPFRTACIVGYYGRNCSHVCPFTCQTCRHTDGLCSCKAGWTGPKCTRGMCVKLSHILWSNIYLGNLCKRKCKIYIFNYQWNLCVNATFFHNCSSSNHAIIMRLRRLYRTLFKSPPYLDICEMNINYIYKNS